MSELRSAVIENEITRDRLAELLNEDLAREYQAIIGYVVYSQVLSGAQYMLFTQISAFLGTPGCMSPEQADPEVHDVDTRRRDAGTLPQEFLPLAEVIQRKAKEVGLE